MYALYCTYTVKQGFRGTDRTAVRNYGFLREEALEVLISLIIFLYMYGVQVEKNMFIVQES